ncbi:dipeptidyl aminopeptidase-like protein 6 [Anopheles ziemanni]|uniref:dipeptidyl aminopeptidase-like protein 6 n=1 Tax=Anopheles coustani TaxID=139045 RepID=UPI002657EB54|nr:dipeptidyl aminopeptidase-like protein 6 [Anopheles coustani]XP_058175716.1 dipeptidyl aminopeptidase-like protein 6 [Anopheles ziemanni]
MNTVQSTGHATVRNKKDSQFEELTVSSSEKRNWRGIFIALLVIAAVLGLIVFSILLLSPEIESSKLHGRRISLYDIKSGRYEWNRQNGSWINRYEYVFINSEGGLTSLQITRDGGFRFEVLMNNATFRQLNVDSYDVSPDRNFVLLYASSDNTQKYNRSYFIYDLAASNVFSLSVKEGDQLAPQLQYVLWAPTTSNGSSRGSGDKAGHQSGPSSTSSGSSSSSSSTSSGSSQGIAFVHQGDIYYKPRMQYDLICRITTNGKDGFVLNGVPDWLYSNVPELKGPSLLFSPDGQHLAYLSFNVSQVQQYQYLWYGEGQQYPKLRSLRYPKVHSANPNVTVYVVNLGVLKYIFPKPISVPAHIRATDSYVGGLSWLSPTELSVTYASRNQSLAHVLLCRAPTFTCVEMFQEKAVANSWVLIGETALFIHRPTLTDHAVNDAPVSQALRNSSGTVTSTSSTAAPTTTTAAPPSALPVPKDLYMLKRLNVRDGSHGYYRHLVLVELGTKRTITLTMGQFEVTEIVGYDERRGLVYFMAAPYHKPGQRHLYKIPLGLDQATVASMTNAGGRGGEPGPDGVGHGAGTHNASDVLLLRPSGSAVPYCVTCGSGSAADGTTSDGEQESQRRPNNCLYNRVAFNDDYTYFVQECLGPESPSTYLVEAGSERKVRVLNDGNELRDQLVQLAKPQIMTFSVQIKYDFNAQVKLFLPPGVKEDDDLQLPLILHIEASPERQLVSEEYGVDWNWYLSSHQSYIIAQIDARGSGFQGESLKTQIRGRVGIEVEDQLAVLMYLRDNLKLVDPNRICVYGKGYGGYIAMQMLATDSSQVLKCVAAISPIVSFRYYNSFFTERYVLQQDDAERSLIESDLSTKVGSLASKNFLIIHSTADCVVHEQHAALLTRSLVNRGIIFRHQMYVDEDHEYRSVSEHLYHTIETYIEENFGNDNQDWTSAFFLSKT